MFKHKFIDDDGNVFTRNSKTRQYSHVLYIKWADKTDGGVYSWHGRRDLAEKSMRTLTNYRRNGRITKDFTLKILPVTELYDTSTRSYLIGGK